jgi:hypothetical protein
LRPAGKRTALARVRDFVVRDLPRSEENLRAIPPFEFENWAVIALGGIPNKVQVGDMGVDEAAKVHRLHHYLWMTVSETVSKSGCGAVKNCGELKQIVLETPIKSAIVE